jgi:hypothetical protein
LDRKKSGRRQAGKKKKMKERWGRELGRRGESRLAAQVERKGRKKERKRKRRKTIFLIREKLDKLVEKIELILEKRGKFWKHFKS